MSAFKPWSAYDAETKVLQNTSNYPSCVSFFQCKETSGDIITDVITGATYDPGTTLTYSVSNAITFPNGTGNNDLASGSIPDITSGYVLAIITAVLGKGTTPVGQLSAAGWGDVRGSVIAACGVYAQGSAPIKGGGWVADGTSSDEATDTTDATVAHSYAVAVQLDASAVFDFYNDSATKASSTPAMTITGFEWQAANALDINNCDLYSQMLFNLTALPTDTEMKSILEWTKYQHVTAGNKVICPWFLNRE